MNAKAIVAGISTNVISEFHENDVIYATGSLPEAPHRKPSLVDEKGTLCMCITSTG